METESSPAPETELSDQEEGVSRRRFIAGGAAAVATLAVGAAALARPGQAARAMPLSKKVVVADPTLCIGCLTCEVECSRWHASVGRSAPPRIRIITDQKVRARESVLQVWPERSGFVPETCRQCYEPWCLPNCPTEGLQIEPETGNRFIQESQCIACGKCEVDCPVTYEGIQTRTNRPIQMKRVNYDVAAHVFNKCDLCIGREGGPVCVERCPVNIAVKRGQIASDNLCLDLKLSDKPIWEKLT